MEDKSQKGQVKARSSSPTLVRAFKEATTIGDLSSIVSLENKKNRLVSDHLNMLKVGLKYVQVTEAHISLRLLAQIYQI